MDPVQVGQPEGSSTFKGRRLCVVGGGFKRSDIHGSEGAEA